MSDFQVAYEEALRMATHHEDAAEAITDLAATMPSDVDGGEGAPQILGIMRAVATDAGSVAQLNTGIGARVRTAVDVTRGYDAAAAEAFDAWGEEIP